MKTVLLYGLLPFVPLLALLGSSSADRSLPGPGAPAASRPPAAVAMCHRFNGQACSPEGFEFRCFNHFPDEPGLCVCTGGIWDCG
jgi:hypothetical protein